MSLEIKKEQGNQTIIYLTGRLDTTTVPQLEEYLSKKLKDCKNLVLDLEKLDYISSAGLRVLLVMQKTIGNEGTLILRNVQETVKEVLEITGFLDILKIE